MPYYHDFTQAEKIIAFLLQTLEVDESPVVQSVLCVGIAKLMLAGLVTDPRVRAEIVIRIQALNPPLSDSGVDEHAHGVRLASDGGQPGAPAVPLLLFARILLLLSSEPTSAAIGEAYTTRGVC